MNILSALRPAWEVLQAGKQLKHAAAWKNVQLVALVITSLASLATAFGIDLGLTQEQILGTAGTIAAIAAYFVPATSAKVGFSVGAHGHAPLQDIDDDPPTPQNDGHPRIGPPSRRLPMAEGNNPPVRAPENRANPSTSSVRGTYDDWADGH